MIVLYYLVFVSMIVFILFTSGVVNFKKGWVIK